MIHILNYSGQIIDFFSKDDNAIIKAMYSRTANTETLNIVVLSSKSTNFKERNRILIQDQMENYREFIIDHIEDSEQYTEVECTASYLVDISTSKPIPAGQYEKMTVNQKLSETLRDSGWSVGSCDFAGIKTNSWTSVRTPLEMIGQLETAHDVVADYEIVIDGYEVVKRLVNMRKPTPLFKGKEIVYGKDLLSMKRKVDFSEVKTALFAFGPEQENGERISLVVHDDVAQEQLGLPQRYIWGLYEPETQEDNMTRQRLETLARTELNKHKSAAISYEVSVVNIEQEYQHETIRFGDLVRIKNTDFTPSLYAESEVIGFDLDLISGDCTYTFGKIVEHKESDLRRYFESKLGYIRQKLNDQFTNVNTIVADVVEGKLEYFERKIIKGVEPPENPVNDMLWFDTSNPNVAVVRRYWNGEWINSTVENAKDVGAVTREQALFSELTNTFINLSIQHSKLLNEMHEITNNEYLVDFNFKDELNAKLDDTVSVYNNIKNNLDSMTDETATIGKLVDTQSLFLTYREKLQALYNVVENAKISINERFKLLQSQYTDEKFNEAMEKVASSINGTWNAETGQLLADIPSQKELEDALKTYINGQDAALKQLIDGEVNSKITQTKNELSSNISAVSAKVDGIQVGGVNMLDGTKDFTSPFNTPNIQKYGEVINGELTSVDYDLASNRLMWATFYTNIPVQPNTDYTISYDAKTKDGIAQGIAYTPIERLQDDGSRFTPLQYVATTQTYKNTTNDFRRYSFTFNTGASKRIRLSFTSKDVNSLANIKKVKLEIGNKATPYEQSPNDISNAITKARSDAEVSAKAYADAQDVLRKTEAQAYADEIVDAEEQRAIADAQAKLEQAKVYAEETQKAAQSYTDKNLKPITTTQTQQSSDIKQLQEGITLKADKKDITTLYDDSIEPLERQVNDNSAELKIQSDKIDSKVSNKQYTADVNDIISKLNSAESQREQLNNAINDRVTIKKYTDNKIETTNQINMAINNIKVGGRNLVKDSHFYNGDINGWSSVYGNQKVENHILIKEVTTLTASNRIERQFSNLTVGENYTLSVYTSVPVALEWRSFINANVMNFNNSSAINRFYVTSVTFTPTNTTVTVRGYLPNAPVGSLIKIDWFKLEKGNKATDWTPAPEDVQANVDKAKAETDKTLDVMQTQINQNGTDINARATKEEFNASKKILSNVISDLSINTTTGLTLSYDENGVIQSANVGPDGIKLDATKLEINDGDVVIQNGRTTIKNLSSEKIKVAFNGITNSVNILPDGLETTSNGLRTSLLDGVGHHFFDSSNYVGNFGATYLSPGNQKGISLNLADYGQFMAFSYRTNKQKETDPNNVAMMWSKGFEGYPKGFLYNEDIIINSNRVLETAYLRPFNAPPEHRLFLSARQTGPNEFGTAIQYNNKNSSAVVFTNNAVKILGYDANTKSMVGLNVYSNSITSETIYNRTYSSAGNVYITEYGTLGRSTSASKYKLSQERQFNDDKQQYEHSKQLLNLDIKTWFDKFEAETYAKEILTGERQEDEDFKLKRYAGLIAEDVEAVGLDEFVTRGKDDEIEGIEYDRLWIHLIPIVKKQMTEIENLKSELEMLKNGK